MIRKRGTKSLKNRSSYQVIIVGALHTCDHLVALLGRDKVHPINHISVDKGLGPFFEPHLSEAQVNGREFTVLRDTASEINVIPIKIITSSH